MGKDKKKKEKTSVVLPKAWQSVKHRNETAQARSNYEDTWKAIQTILIILLILFVILGGVSQTGILKFIFNWSTNVGQSISNWLEGGSIITNEDGIYWDPSGQQGDKIGDENAPEVINPMDVPTEETTETGETDINDNNDIIDTTENVDTSGEQSEEINSEVNTE